jgi:hypothetical protein
VCASVVSSAVVSSMGGSGLTDGSGAAATMPEETGGWGV